MLTVPTVSDDFSRADAAHLGGAYEPLPAHWPLTSDRHTHIREQCATIQQVAITIAIPVFAVLTAILLAGLCRAVWMF
jgi:hypothetical protein